MRFNRKLKTCIILFSLCILYGGVRAQVPGYLGKKFSVYYNGSAYLRLASDRYKKDFNRPPSGWGINYRHNFDVDFAVSKSACIGASFKMLRTGDDKDLKHFHGFEVYENPNSYPDQGEIRSEGKGYVFSSAYTNVKGRFVTLYLKKFLFKRKGSMAPMGTYHKLEAGVAIINATADSFEVKYTVQIDKVQNNQTFTSTFNYPSEKLLYKTITQLAFFYSFGHQVIIADRFYIDGALELGFIPNSLPYSLNYSDYENSGGGSNYDVEKIKDGLEHQKRIYSVLRVQRHITTNFHVGVGILLF